MLIYYFSCKKNCKEQKRTIVVSIACHEKFAKLRCHSREKNLNSDRHYRNRFSKNERQNQINQYLLLKKLFHESITFKNAQKLFFSAYRVIIFHLASYCFFPTKCSKKTTLILIFLIFLTAGFLCYAGFLAPIPLILFNNEELLDYPNGCRNVWATAF